MSQLIRGAIPAGILAFTFGAALAALNYGGVSFEAARGSDAMVLWVLPLAKLLFNISAAGTVGTLILICFALSPGTREYRRALNFAAAWAAVWTVTSAASAVLSYIDAAPGVLDFGNAFGPQFPLFLTTIGLGQTWSVTTLIAATVALGCLIVGNIGAVAMVGVLAAVGMVPLTLNSHPNYGANHEPGMAALGLHIISAAVWLGGMMALVAVRPFLRADRLVPVVRRYSTLALICYIVLAASGYLKATISIGSFENLWSPYGVLVLAKGAALLVLGAAGFLQRRWIVRAMESRGVGSIKYFWGLVAGELAFLGIASGIAAALARVDDPNGNVPSAYATLAENMVDHRLPAYPTLWHYLLETRFDPIWVLLCCVGIFAYVAGVRRLHRRGQRWPPHRTVSWLVGALALLYISNGGVNAYRGFLFSAHAITQMALLTIIPLLLVAGAPVALAGRAIRARGDGSRGGREWIRVIARSRLVVVATAPLAATGVLLASLLIFYYPPVLRWSISNQIGHQWMMVHLLLAGSLFVTSVIRGHSPFSRPSAGPLIAVGVVLVGFAVLGIALAAGTDLLQPQWYGAMGRPWGMDPLHDQQAGGTVVVIIAVLQTAGLAIMIARTRCLRPSHLTPSTGTEDQVPSTSGGARQDHEPVGDGSDSCARLDGDAPKNSSSPSEAH
ncbi:bifunctional copper resistance protein CopD/cytochrome c oxidase assembly protein [Paenarthrobacter sp. Z7-10]|uniref:cytochrome c oxidase assembly protein n=1 Tax=Paenarthrobacter sp. Z7-10 TaxID=2787635 RepID=UPI0022A8F120|nr:cytochrome c oxidase assembly protein [Paenarthrobacter sp. Z7-10]MCZ2402966.1 bifunctional copper resistance protein CopD/cytochrome c oxidase assembly protein [Paenarthrobacter sp. Z7-10]